MPLKDRESADYLYIIYPNRLSFELCVKENRTQLVNLHNYGQKCMEFRWQKSVLVELVELPKHFHLHLLLLLQLHH